MHLSSKTVLIAHLCASTNGYLQLHTTVYGLNDHLFQFTVLLLRFFYNREQINYDATKKINIFMINWNITVRNASQYNFGIFKLRILPF